jgi:MoaA/NifB/PqqE/SkfB family radical SAM enzyme
MKKGLMQQGLFKKIFDQLKESLLCINLYSWGEPLLNPDLAAMITYAKNAKKNLRILTSTNLNIRDDKLLQDLMRCGIDEIIVSADGASAATYSEYRRGGDFDLVVRNMKLLAEFKNQSASDTEVVWNFLVFKHNEHEIGKAKALAKELGVRLRIGKMRTSMKEEILRPHSESIRKYKEWIPDSPQYSAYDKEKCVTKVRIKTCRKPWSEISINWDGRVFPCCAVYGDGFSFGDASRESVRGIWNNAMYSQARAEILRPKLKAGTVCGICRDHSFMHM